eukprot:228955_1
MQHFRRIIKHSSSLPSFSHPSTKLIKFNYQYTLSRSFATFIDLTPSTNFDPTQYTYINNNPIEMSAPQQQKQKQKTKKEKKKKLSKAERIALRQQQQAKTKPRL